MIHKAIIIVGGGPVGMSAAIKLARAGHKDITLIDANTASDKLSDGRVLAMSYASCQLLEAIGAWDNNLATKIKYVHMSHSGLGVSQINAQDVCLPELGYTVKYTDLCYKLEQCMHAYPEIKLTQAVVSEVIPGKNYATIIYNNNQYVTADLVILAEGGKIKLNQVEYKEYDYDQTAIIATLKTQLKPNNTAFERFDDSGALVLLPHGNEYVLVWSVSVSDALHLQNLENLRAALNGLKFMKRFGQFEISGKIHGFPLKLQVAKNRALPRVVLLGNSAQIVHPVSAQGLNLGLRDVDALLELISEDINNIHDYDKLRNIDSHFVINFTHFLARFIHSAHTRHLRGLGLIALSNLKPVQNKLANSLIFGN